MQYSKRINLTFSYKFRAYQKKFPQPSSRRTLNIIIKNALLNEKNPKLRFDILFLEEMMKRAETLEAEILKTEDKEKIFEYKLLINQIIGEIKKLFPREREIIFFLEAMRDSFNTSFI